MTAPDLAERARGPMLAALAADDMAQPAAIVSEVVRTIDPLATEAVVAEAARMVLADIAGLGPLDPVLSDPAVTEVMINGPGPVWVERSGQLICTEHHLDLPGIERLVERIVAPLGLRVDRARPVVDARLLDGSRVSIVIPPLAVDGPVVTIRRFGTRRVSLDDVAPPGVAPLLRWAVAARLNVLVTGGTGSGKTTLLNSLAGLLDRSERIVTIEDAAELSLDGDHVVRLEGRPETVEGLAAVTIRDLVRASLRMRPDRIIVGEVRGPEALDMVQAMNTGHEGSLSTLHANGAADALGRLETMVLQAGVGLPLDAVRSQIGASVDLLVQTERAAGGARRISEVAEVTADGRRARPLADRSGLAELPQRAPRHLAAGEPDPRWLP